MYWSSCWKQSALNGIRFHTSMFVGQPSRTPTMSDISIDMLIRSVTSLSCILNPQGDFGQYPEIPDSDRLETLLNQLALLFVTRNLGDVAAIAIKIEPERAQVLASDSSTCHVTEDSCPNAPGKQDSDSSQ